MTAEFLEQDVAIGTGRARCADCERLRILEADGRCSECLHFRPVPVKAHQPRPEYRVRYTDWRGQSAIHDVVHVDAVMKIMEWDPSVQVSRLSLDGTESPMEFNLNSKAGVLR